MYGVQNNIGEYSFFKFKLKTTSRSLTASPKEVEESKQLLSSDNEDGVLLSSSQYKNEIKRKFVGIPSNIMGAASTISTTSNNNQKQHITMVIDEKEEIDNQLRIRDTTRKDITLNVAWLLSFPKSGTTYTLSLYQSVTKTTAATNYGMERFDASGTNVIESNTIHKSIPLLNSTTNTERLNGPFILTPNLPLSSKGGYVLTKTHCSGYCFDCPPAWYHYSPTRFLKGCVSGQYYNNDNNNNNNTANNMKWVEYDPTIIKKAIHLIRDPFDNIVSRYHHELHRYRNPNSYSNNPSANNYWNPNKFTNTIDGFRSWCDYQDTKWKFHYIKSWKIWDEQIFNASIHVPCKKEFYQYIKWHNNAFEIIRAMKIPRIIVHYEDYSYNLIGTTRKMMNFLEHGNIDMDMNNDNTLPKVRPIMHYMDYYRPYTLKYSIQFLKVMSSAETWFALIRRYPYLGNAPTVPPELPGLKI